MTSDARGRRPIGGPVAPAGASGPRLPASPDRSRPARSLGPPLAVLLVLLVVVGRSRLRRGARGHDPAVTSDARGSASREPAVAPVSAAGSPPPAEPAVAPVSAAGPPPPAEPAVAPVSAAGPPPPAEPAVAPVSAAGPPSPASRGRSRPPRSLLPLLASLLALLLVATAVLWFTRPRVAPVRSAEYTAVLDAARAAVVDLTSFDYRSLDDDVAQAREVTTGSFRRESVDRLEAMRDQLTSTQAVVTTDVLTAGVARAELRRGTVLLVVQSTQQTGAAPAPAVARYPLRVELEKVGGRWLLAGVAAG